MYLLDVQPFLDLISGQENSVARWASGIPRTSVFISSVTAGYAEHTIESSPLPAFRRSWRHRLVTAKSEFQKRTFDFQTEDASVWASQVLLLDLTDTDEEGEHRVDPSALMIAAQALNRRFILVTARRPYHDVLEEHTGLEILDPYAGSSE